MAAYGEDSSLSAFTFIPPGEWRNGHERFIIYFSNISDLCQQTCMSATFVVLQAATIIIFLFMFLSMTFDIH